MPQVEVPYELHGPGGTTSGTTLVDVEQSELNSRELLDKAEQALELNDTFLAIANPTNAEAVQQLRRLTRQTNALIRLLVGRLEATDDT